jgi:hypothetical protein
MADIIAAGLFAQPTHRPVDGGEPNPNVITIKQTII